METAEGSILLVDGPRLSVKFDFNYIFSICSVIGIVFNHPRLLNCENQGNFEENRSSAAAVLRASLDMVNEALRREKYVAELTLL